MRILITGGSGFVGAHLVKKLIDTPLNGQEKIGVLRRKETDFWRLNELENGFTSIFLEEVSSFDPHNIIHLAWQGVAGALRNTPMQEENLLLLHSLLQQSKNLQYFVSIGSQAEYGRKLHASKEMDPLAPFTAYGAAKVAMVNYLTKTLSSHQIPYCHLRLFSPYGPKDHRYPLIPYVITHLLEGKLPKLTKGEQMWDFIYIDDVTEAMYRILEKKLEGIYNIGSGSTISISLVCQKIAREVNTGLELVMGEEPYRKDQIFHLEADVSLLKEKIGEFVKTPIDRGIKNTISYYKEHMHEK